MGDSQEIASGGNVAFDINPDDIEIVGDNIEVDSSGEVFTITQSGLYQVEWAVNLQSGTQPIVLCLMENGGLSSPMSNTSQTGNFSSGALINVTDADLPYTVSLHNFGGPISITEPDNFEGAAASIRILRFADGPSV